MCEIRQLGGKDIFTSGLIHKDVLLSTGECVWHIVNGMEKNMQEGTAVIGDANLRMGKSIIISKVAYHSRFVMDRVNYISKFCDLGVVRVGLLKFFYFVTKS